MVDSTNEDASKGVSQTVANSPLSGSSSGNDSALLALLQGRTTGPTRRSAKGGWTKEEDDLLTQAVKKYNGKNWKKIAAETFPGRSDVQCLHRWQKVLNPDLVKGPWTKEEDDRIVELVDKFGSKKWSSIAQHLPGRIGKQCRERWHNHLNPAIKKDAWSKEEELTLIRAHRIYGNKWAEIARFLPGRADNSIKNHWNCSVKKKLDLYPGEFPGIDAPGFYNLEREEPVAVNYVNRMALNGRIDTNMGPSVLGNLNGVNKNLEKPKEAKNSKSLQVANRQSKSCAGFQFNGSNAAGCAPVVEHRGDAEHACLRQDLHHSVVKPKESLAISSGDSFELTPSRQCMNESVGRTNCSSMPPSGQNTLTATSLKFPLDLACSPNTAFSVTKRLPDSPKRPRHYASPISEPGGISRFHSECDHSFTNSSVCELGTAKSQLSRWNKVPMTPQNEDIHFVPLHCETQLQQNVTTFLANGRPSNTDNYTHLANSPVCSTPPSHMRSISVSGNSPASILRSAARTFKNTPSIIRKRRYGTCTQAYDANDSKNPCTPEVSSRSSKDMMSTENSCPTGQEDLKSKEYLKAQWLSLSSPNYSQPEMIASVKSVEKRLQYAFDMEWDKSNCKSNTLATESDASDGILEQSTGSMLDS